MSTIARIGIKNSDGTVTSIYCHNDGHLVGVGECLLNNYKTEEKINKLMKLGDISALGTEPISNPNAWKSPGVCTDPAAWVKRWKELNPEDMCNTYASRGEDVPARVAKNKKEYQHDYSGCVYNYIYLFQDGKWYVDTKNGRGFCKLTRAKITRGY